MNNAPDPGGIFASDAHRHVAGHLPDPKGEYIGPNTLLLRLLPDPATSFTEEMQLVAVLEDLAGDGLVKGTSKGWRLTAAGLEALTGPIANEPAPMEGKALEKAEAENADLAEAEQALEASTKQERVEELQAALEDAESEVEDA